LSDKTLNFFVKNEFSQISKGNGFRLNVTDGSGIAKTITTRAGSRMDDNFIGDKDLAIKNVITNEPIIVASRCRNPENPSDRTSGIHTEQRLEPNLRGISNTITTVQKDNYVLEKSRIRKLTPKECWRLQGFADEDIDKCITGGISDTQLYKQAGNSITVDVAEELLCMLFDEDGDFYI
jgi:site-specific DNA-cytosine methylase